MKKQLLFALVACAASCAWAAEVYSENVVGYTKVTVQPGFNLLGSSFVQVGTGEAADINDAIKNNGLPGLNEDFSDFATTVMTWTGSGYKTYGYVTAEQANDENWLWPESANMWILGDMSDIAVVPVPTGDGFWVQTTGTGTITLIGQVPAAATTDVNIKPGFSLVSCPYAKDINIQDVKVNGLPGLNEDFSDFNTTLMTWTGSGYKTYGYVTAEQADDENWLWPESANKWILGDMSDIADVTIPAGAGFWIQTTGTGSVTFTK